MISIQISESLKRFSLPNQAMNDLLELAAQTALAQQATYADSDVSLVLADDAQLQSLNQNYLGIDAPTDVLAFPAGDTDPDTGICYLGDVLVSYPRAVAQAAAGGHSVEAELQLLVVHGILHLCGYDHSDQESKSAMWAMQASILRLLDCSINGPALEPEI